MRAALLSAVKWHLASAILLVVLSAVGAQAVDAGTFDHSRLDELLTVYVSDDGWVDYAGLERDSAKLGAYLKTLATAAPKTFASDDERLAFWINAYNAFTLQDALESVYRKAKGVREVPGFFDRKDHSVASERLTLDQIEARARRFRDPRVHFTLVCASTSCPKLQRYSYRGEQLQEQLARVTREFLSDSERGMKIDPRRNKVFISSLFKWYAGDFTGAGNRFSRAFAIIKAYLTNGRSVINYVKKHAPAEQARYLEERRPKLGYLAYDWSLNSQEGRGNTKAEK